MDLRFLGGLLLIIGTTIGGAMLALPIATAQSGFLGAILLLVGSWMVMTIGAFLILEVNLWLPQDSNIISMARATLGRAGEGIAWVVYLLLLYSLLAAYVAGGADMLHNLLQIIHINIHTNFTALAFILILGFVVYCGIEHIDFVNRGLMLIKFISLFLLIGFIFPHIDQQPLQKFQPQYLISAITLFITSFGFSTIVPSMRSYFDGDIKKLRLAIILGSFVPLIIYILWVASVLGALPLTGENSLLAILKSDHPTSQLTQALIHSLDNPWLTTVTRIFTSICVATSFLGVALCLSDFVSDGFKLKKQGKQKILIYFITFFPPFLIVIFYPAAFIMALSYAGILCALLLILLPALMVWSGRYRLGMVGNYRVMGGKFLLLLAIIASLFIVLQELLIKLNVI